jgi:hypothetical protein
LAFLKKDIKIKKNIKLVKYLAKYLTINEKGCTFALVFEQGMIFLKIYHLFA